MQPSPWRWEYARMPAPNGNGRETPIAWSARAWEKKRMRSTLVALTIALIGIAPVPLRAETKDAAGDPDTVTVEQLATLRAAGTATVVDANGAETRQKYGVIPGALLLTHYGDFDAAKELPP